MIKLPRHYVVYILIPVFTWLFYSGLLVDGINRILTDPNAYNYFKDLAASFLQGRLDIDCPPESKCLDLVHFNGKIYLYWPPVPAVVYMPFVVLFGTNTWDSAICTLFGLINVVLFLAFIRRFAQRFKIPLDLKMWVLFGLFWALGTVHFYMSMNGAVWFVSQVMAQTFLLLALIFFLKQEKFSLLWSGLFFALACYTRNNLVFYIFFFASLFYILYQRPGIKAWFIKGTVFMLPFLVMTLLNMAYNYARFGNIMENGLKYHQMADYFEDNFEKYGYFSIHYIPGNAECEVIRLPPFSSTYPFFKYQEQGFGLLWASPVFLLLAPGLLFLLYELFRRAKKRQQRIPNDDMVLMGGLWLSAIGVALIIFSIMGTGWAQFGSRYSLDYQLLLIVFVLFNFKRWPESKILRNAFFILLLISAYMNYNGVKMFYYIPY